MTPRYGRLAAFTVAVLVTLVTVLGGLGILPTSASASYAAPAVAAAPDRNAATAVLQVASTHADRAASAWPWSSGRPVPDPELVAYGSDADAVLVFPVPEDSGTGKRVVFSISQQRVWLVAEDGSVKRTYRVSGSVTDNLAPGVYRVYSRSSHASGIDDSGTMRYMVRFAYGTRAAIGFHDIPVKDGRLVQTRQQLGTPRSHGCIRQWRPDAQALWRFAPVGTEVDVTA